MTKPKPVTVEITQLDIREGVAKEPLSCPVALAITRALGQPAEVGALSWCSLDDMVIHHLPARVCKFIARFDHHARVEPMTFRINARPHARRRTYP